MSKISLSDIRTDYKKLKLDEHDMAKDPIEQFKRWFEEVIESQVTEPNAMTLATADENGIPSARIVLLKKIEDGGFYFFTNYKSRKGKELAENKHVALVFFWKELERQVRILGSVKKAEEKISDAYYFSRPRGSQLGAWTSHQSEQISSREVLKAEMAALEKKFENKSITRPPFWGGYRVEPREIEFWQGRPSRLHDRLVYRLSENSGWDLFRLSP